jgi:hypothetical protein
MTCIMHYLYLKMANNPQASYPILVTKMFSPSVCCTETTGKIQNTPKCFLQNTTETTGEIQKITDLSMNNVNDSFSNESFSASFQ